VEAIDAEILRQLGRVERRELTVVQFEDWFVPRTWGHRTKLAAALDHTLAEKSLLTEDQLIAELLYYAREVMPEYAPTA